MKQTEDENNFATYFSIGNNSLQGKFQIPSTLIFKSFPVKLSM